MKEIRWNVELNAFPSPVPRPFYFSIGSLSSPETFSLLSFIFFARSSVCFDSLPRRLYLRFSDLFGSSKGRERGSRRTEREGTYLLETSSTYNSVFESTYEKRERVCHGRGWSYIIGETGIRGISSTLSRPCF